MPIDLDYIPAFIEGYATLYDVDDSQSAYLDASLGKLSLRPAFTIGAVLLTDAQSAFILGGVGTVDSQAAFIASSGGLVRSSIFAFIQAQDTDAQQGYLRGAMVTVNGTEIVIIGGVLYG